MVPPALPYQHVHEPFAAAATDSASILPVSEMLGVEEPTWARSYPPSEMRPSATNASPSLSCHKKSNLYPSIPRDFIFSASSGVMRFIQLSYNR